MVQVSGAVVPGGAHSKGSRGRRPGSVREDGALAAVDLDALEEDRVDLCATDLLRVGARIAVEDHEISVLAGLDRADAVGHAERRGPLQGEQPQGLAEAD